MKKVILSLVIVGLLIFLVAEKPSLPKKPLSVTSAAQTAATSTPVLLVTPQTILQGDPVMIVVKNANLSDIKSANIGSTSLHFALYKNTPTAFYGSDIRQKIGAMQVKVVLKSGVSLSSSFTITARTHPNESLPVPEQLGGNSTSSQELLVSNLEKENAEISAIKSDETQSFWSSAFEYPIKAPIVITDPYGYNRESGAETIIHKGTDFKAPPGTPVYAINDGVVRTATLFTVYGNTIILDHGLGIESFYMHLSKITVQSKEKVTKGELIGYSGETGYAEGPHLHLSIRINGSSIDPIKFFALF